MFGGLFRFLVKLAAAGLVLYLARAALQRWVDGPDPAPGDARWDRARLEPSPPAAATATAPAVPVPAKSVSVKVKAKAKAAPAWVPPGEDGMAPPSHPVKVKLSSGIYHVPGGALYARTKPDRCYTTPEAAEADGFVRAKR